MALLADDTYSLRLDPTNAAAVSAKLMQLDYTAQQVIYGWAEVMAATLVALDMPKPAPALAADGTGASSSGSGSVGGSSSGGAAPASLVLTKPKSNHTQAPQAAYGGATPAGSSGGAVGAGRHRRGVLGWEQKLLAGDSAYGDDDHAGGRRGALGHPSFVLVARHAERKDSTNVGAASAGSTGNAARASQRRVLLQQQGSANYTADPLVKVRRFMLPSYVTGICHSYENKTLLAKCIIFLPTN